MATQTEFPAVANLPAQPNLPDAFVMFDGTPVTTPEQWTQQRRPELKALFQHYMYGVMPPPPGIQSAIRKFDATALHGKATLKEIDIWFDGLPEGAPTIHLMLLVPNHVAEPAQPTQPTQPAPVILALNMSGNAAITADADITLYPNTWVAERWKEMGATQPGAHAAFWTVENMIERGYAFATFHESDIDPDQVDFDDGIHPYYPELGVPDAVRWGTLAAWAWGLQRCVDYLVTDPAIDAQRIIVTGHSRRGKAALLAGAFDERFALVSPHQSGTGGCALSRGNDQETVKLINDRFPHWFNGVFKQFNDQEPKLPFDQHLLSALVAPRALLDTEGNQDAWASPDGAYRALQATDAVYKFLGAPGMVGRGQLQGEARIDAATAGNLLQYRRDTEHTLNADYWNALMDFADVVL